MIPYELKFDRGNINSAADFQSQCESVVPAKLDIESDNIKLPELKGVDIEIHSVTLMSSTLGVVIKAYGVNEEEERKIHQVPNTIAGIINYEFRNQGIRYRQYDRIDKPDDSEGSLIYKQSIPEELDT